jgi:hypothetical protein
LLLWQPPLFNPPDPANPDDYIRVTSDASAFSGVRWADIGFLIKPDGTTESPEWLRGNGSPAWANVILRAIAGRRYAPTGTSAGLYRIERWTLTSDYATSGGTMVRRRSAFHPHYEQLDFTPAAPADDRDGTTATPTR